MKRDKLLLVTHASENYDPQKAILPNLEDFIDNHPNYDIIRIKHPFIDDYLLKGSALPSENGIIPSNLASSIVAAYDVIVTAGGYFEDCALNTFDSLARAHFQQPKKELEIVVPLSLFYCIIGFHKDPRGRKILAVKSETIEGIIATKDNKRWSNIQEAFEKRIEILDKYVPKDIKLRRKDTITEKDLISYNSGLTLNVVISHKQL